jgi:hypothetical protein
LYSCHDLQEHPQSLSLPARSHGDHYCVSPAATVASPSAARGRRAKIGKTKQPTNEIGRIRCPPGTTHHSHDIFVIASGSLFCSVISSIMSSCRKERQAGSFTHRLAWPPSDLMIHPSQLPRPVHRLPIRPVTNNDAGLTHSFASWQCGRKGGFLPQDHAAAYH